jgi:hypothetical protein
LKTGASAALLYVGCYALAGPVLNAAPGDDGSLVIVVLFVGCIIGVLPALLIGALTGRIIAMALAQFWARLSSVRAALLGVLVCTLFALPLNVIFWPEAFGPFRSGGSAGVYAFMLGAPSLIYIIIGGVMSARLYKTHLIERPSVML